MAPNLTEDEIDDLIFFARAGENEELKDMLRELATREQTSDAEILVAAKDQGKSTCLHMATGNGHLETVKILLNVFDGSRPKEEKQAYLDAGNEFGNTGLHWAALGGHLDVVKLLLEQGASGAIANDSNYVPLDLANFNGHAHVAEHFLSLSGKIEGQNQSGLNGAAASIELDGHDDAVEDEQGSKS